MEKRGFPKLRAVDARPIVRSGRPAVVLLDPLRLTERMIVVPEEWAPLLALCDGTRDAAALRAALALHFGVSIGPDALGRLIAALDDALLLENERFEQAQARALAEFRDAPFRAPALAGQSYAADADELSRQLRESIHAVDDAAPGGADARGLVSPHIDYARGGPTYAHVWKRAAEAVEAAELVVLLGTDHFGGDGRLTLTRQHYATPLGVLPTAQQVVDDLAQALGEDEAFAEELYHRGEHSIELAAVWLQHVRGERPCEAVPILCGSFGHFVRGEAELEGSAAVAALVGALRRVAAQRRTLLVAAGDLSHVGPAFGGPPQGLMERARLQAADGELVDRICQGDPRGFFAAIERDGDRRNVCGLPPIYLALRVLSPVVGEMVFYDRCPADEHGTSLVSVCGILLR
jgi:AmmeMemoRadiSam system protein B